MLYKQTVQTCKHKHDHVESARWENIAPLPSVWICLFELELTCRCFLLRVRWKVRLTVSNATDGVAII